MYERWTLLQVGVSIADAQRQAPLVRSSLVIR